MLQSLNIIAYIAEQKIEEAIKQGMLDNLPGQGKPLDIEDTSHIPPDLRMAYTMLRTSGYIEKPAKSATDMASVLDEMPEEKHSYRKILRLKVLMKKHNKSNYEDSAYLEKIIAKI